MVDLVSEMSESLASYRAVLHIIQIGMEDGAVDLAAGHVDFILCHLNLLDARAAGRIECACIQRAHDLNLVIQCRQKNDGEILAFFAPLFAQGNAVSVRKPHIHKAQGKIFLCGDGLRFAHAARGKYAVSLARKQFAHSFAQDGVILYQ